MHDIKTDFNGTAYLEKGHVTQVVKLKTFRDLKETVLALKYPKPGHSKDECYGLVATPFKPVLPKPATFYLSHPDLREPAKYIRQGEWQEDSVSFFYADIDNKMPFAKAKIEDVASRLKDKFGWNFFIYTTFSHTEAVHKFRVFIETNRTMTRREAAKIAILLNKELFRGQADYSVYSPAAFIYAPPYKAEMASETAPDGHSHLSGSPIVVDDLLAKAEALILAEPHRLLYAANTNPKDDQKKLARQLSKAMFSPKINETSIRPCISISNPNVFAAEWVEHYKLCPAHWSAMRSILGRVWRMTDGDLTYAEMEKLFYELDAETGGYMGKKYSAKRIRDLLRWYFTIPASGANDNWQPILDQEPLGLRIQVVEAECGAGKTYSEFLRMSVEYGRYIYSVPKIADIAERKKELRAIVGGDFDILEVHGQASLKCVPEQLSLLRRDLLRMQNLRPTVVFTTHAATLAYDWKKWDEFELIYDEIPEIFTLAPLRASKHPEIIKSHINPTKGLDGQCYRVSPTAEGRQALKCADIDDYDAADQDVLREAVKRNAQTWIKKDEWDRLGAVETLNFFSLFTPKNLTNFRSVRVLADEAMQSTTLRIWAEKWGVALEKMDFKGRQRTFPTSGRVSIKYFSEDRDSSIDVFEKNPSLLPDIFAQIDAAHPIEDVLWTANSKLKSGINMPKHTFITPKAHGRNDLQNHIVVAWMAALKPSAATADLVKGICGMSYKEVVAWREYNAMYQFVMRCILRDYGSNVPVTIYVFSKAQAEYLQGRLGGNITWIGKKLATIYKEIGPKNAPLAANERKMVSKWSNDILSACVPDFNALPGSAAKRKVNPKLIPLINQAAKKKLAEKAQASSLASPSPVSGILSPQSCQIISFPLARRTNGKNVSRPVRGRGRPFGR